MYRYLVLVILLLLFENIMASCPAYDRRDYPHRIYVDHDCQNTPHKVLVEEPTVPVQFKISKKCRVVNGKCWDLCIGKKFNDLVKLDINHVVPLRKLTNPEPMHGIKQYGKPLRMNSKIRST